MKPGNLLPLFLFPLAALGQWSGSGTMNGISFTYEAKLEPSSPGITKTGGGLLTDRNVAHRHFLDFTSNGYFGYDLTLEAVSEGRYQMRLAPLSMSPRRIQALFANDRGWKPLPMPKPSAVEIVRPGDTIAIDLFVNPSTGQKIVDYITIEQGPRKLAAGNVERPAPPLTLTLANGILLSLPQPPGKICAIEFLLTNCGHCGPPAELLSKLQTEYGTRRLQVLGVALNQQAPTAQFVLDHKLNFPVGTADMNSVRRFLDVAPASRLLVPILVLIDRNGIIRYQSPSDGGIPLDEAKLRSLIDSI